jgi:FAD/FMN-containing dehydrogenase
VIVNDIHSRLNETAAGRIIEVRSLESLRQAVLDARQEGSAVSVAGGWHAMGGQQFIEGGAVIDTRPMQRVLELDAEAGTIEVEAGIQWPALVSFLSEAGKGGPAWGIAQKQSGADRFTIGGSISVNAHGRGLTMQPLVADVDSLRVVTADGALVRCSREENRELFSHVAGGYGLFGAIYSATLRLAPAQKIERVVEIATADGIVDGFRDRIAHGFVYGDFQFAIDPASPDFLRRGVFSCYRPADPEAPVPEDQRVLSREDWQRLLVLAHTDKTRAFEEYATHYLATSGQIYWSDLHQLADYTDGYHVALDQFLGAEHPATEVIGELYVPRERLADFLQDAAAECRRLGADVIYGTVRLIERDRDTALPWAKDDFACTIFNLHTVHTEKGIARTADTFRALIDLAIARAGSYFLTYHRWARKDQVEACYPGLPAFLEAKQRHDPQGLFQSDWYRHLRAMFDES